MNSREGKTSGELKQEVLHELRQVNNDFDRIQSRMTPGQIVDDAILRPGHNDPRAVFDHLTANPIGTALLGLGTLLLMEDDSYVTYESHIKTRTRNTAENARYQYTLAKGRVSDVNEKVSAKVHEVTGKAHEFSGKVHGAIDKTKGKVNELKGKLSKTETHFTGEQSLGEGGELGASSIDQIRGNISDVRSNVEGKFEDVKANVEGKIGMVKDEITSLRTTVRELDPMTIMAIGAGLGALTGISMPVSEKEQALVDQRLAGNLTGISGELQEAINKSTKILKDEFLGKFTDFDVSIFNRKSNPTNETYRSEGSSFDSSLDSSI